MWWTAAGPENGPAAVAPLHRQLSTSARSITGEQSLTEYQFHTHTAKHYFCKSCGIYPFHRKRVTPDYYGVNVFCLEDFDPAGIPVRATIGKGML